MLKLSRKSGFSKHCWIWLDISLYALWHIRENECKKRTDEGHANVYKRELRWTNGRCKRSDLIRAERRKVLSGESGTSEGLRRQEREKMFQVELQYTDKQPTVSRNQLTRSPSLKTPWPFTHKHTPLLHRGLEKPVVHCSFKACLSNDGESCTTRV